MTTLTVRQTFFLIALFIGTSLTFITLDSRQALDPVKTGLTDILNPITNAFNRVAEGPGRNSALQEELAQVKAERDAWRAQYIEAKVAADEVEQLRAQVDVEEQHPEWTLLQARVINSDPTAQQKFITIDRGANDGVEVGMAVVDPYNYVGQVTDVSETTARVMLIVDTSQLVGAMLLDSGADGIVYGRWQAGDRLVMERVNRDIEPQPGELVITSDIASSRTAKVPPNLPIGVVDGEPELDRQNDTLSIPVFPAADFDNLKVVSVIIADES